MFAQAVGPSLRIRAFSQCFVALGLMISPLLACSQIAPASGPVSQAATLPPAVDSTATSAVEVTAAATPQDAVEYVLATFTLNDLVTVPALGRSLSSTGSWGVQSKFADGLPKICLQNQVPCVRVVYRVPEAKVTCEWIVGFLVAAERQQDGSMKHVLREVALDENEDAARYTLKKKWNGGESYPQTTHVTQIEYPELARGANITGVVVLRLVVGTNGRVQSAASLSGPPVLAKAVVDAARQWTFAPEMIGDRSVGFRLDTTIRMGSDRPAFSDGDPASGNIIMGQTDPHFAPGFHSTGAASAGQWESCSAVNCTEVAAPTPK